MSHSSLYKSIACLAANSHPLSRSTVAWFLVPLVQMGSTPPSTPSGPSTQLSLNITAFVGDGPSVQNPAGMHHGGAGFACPLCNSRAAPAAVPLSSATSLSQAAAASDPQDANQDALPYANATDFALEVLANVPRFSPPSRLIERMLLM